MGESNGQYGTNRERLMDDLKLVSQDAEQLLRSTSQKQRDSDAAALDMTLESLLELEETLAAAAREAMQAADRTVQRYPWQSIGIGAAAGLLLGLLIGRR